MRDIEAELREAEEKVWGNVCRACNRPIEDGRTIADRSTGWPKCNACDTVRLDEYGCVVWLLDGTLFCTEIGDFERFGTGEDTACEVTAPENQGFLDAANKVLGTDFRYEDYPGR